MAKEFLAKLSLLLEDAQAKLRTGFSWELLTEVFHQFIYDAMLAARDELLNPGPEKKAAVLEWVQALLDYVFTSVPFPLWLSWAKLPYVSSGIKSIVMAMASSLIESLYTQNKEQFSG